MRNFPGPKSRIRQEPFVHCTTGYLDWGTYLIVSLMLTYRSQDFTASSSWEIIKYNSVDGSYNHGMDRTSGKFTAPKTGTYQFIFQVFKVSHFSPFTLLHIVEAFWEGHIIWKKISHFVLKLLSNTNIVGFFLKNFVAFSKYRNFT